MGVSIQFESHTVELWTIYTMEYARAVLEFFDQPSLSNFIIRGRPSEKGYDDGAIQPGVLRCSVSSLR
jgi:hypothetical protein